MISQNYENWHDEPMWKTYYLNIPFPIKRKSTQKESIIKV